MYKLLKLNGQYENAINEYIADEFSDLAQIEAPIYSLAYVVEDKKNQILNSNNEWEEYVGAAGGGGSSLPDITAEDEGKVLSVDQGEAVWGDAPSGLPEITAEDEGKVLSVDQGEAVWAESSGGGDVLVAWFPHEVDVEIEGTTVPAYVTDITFNEINTALNQRLNAVMLMLPYFDSMGSTAYPRPKYPERYTDVDGVVTLFTTDSDELVVINEQAITFLPELADYVGKVALILRPEP